MGLLINVGGDIKTVKDVFMKTQKIKWSIGIGMVLVVFLTGCASFSQEGVAQGRYFRGLISTAYDPSKPIEEQSILINLGDTGLRLGLINGKKARDKLGQENAPFTSILTNAFTVLQAGTHNIHFYYVRERGYGSYIEGNVDMRFTFEAGKCYVVTGGPSGSQLSVKIANLADYATVPVYGSTNVTREQVPVASVIEGINSALRRGLEK